MLLIKVNLDVIYVLLFVVIVGVLVMKKGWELCDYVWVGMMWMIDVVLILIGVGVIGVMIILLNLL